MLPQALLSAITSAEWTSGAHWYADAHAECAALAGRYRLTPERVIAAVAILSPGLAWSRNIPEAETLIAAWRESKPLPLVGVYGTHNRDKAVNAISAPVFSVTDHISERTSPKVWNFYHCLLSAGRSEHVCIDRHAKAAALDIRENRDAESIVKGFAEYRRLAGVYLRTAESLSVLPATLQASVWVHWRARWGLT